jgi:hypothetical protein
MDGAALRDNELTEDTGIVHVSNARCNCQTGSKFLKTCRIRSCCAKTVLAHNHSVAWGLVQGTVNLTEAGCAQFDCFQCQAASYRRKLVSAANSLFSKSHFEDSPYRWNK